MIEPTLNQVNGTAVLTFRDGVPRLFDLSVEAIILAEQLVGVSLLNPASAFVWASVRGIRALLYGGLYADAVARKEPWSPQRMAELVDLADIPLLNHVCGWAIGMKIRGPEALHAEGETQATVKGPMGKPTRGRGRKSSRSPART